jgi:hypothetical protein
MNEQMSIFDMLYPDKINPIRELIRNTEPYWSYSKELLINMYNEDPDLRDLRGFANTAKRQYCTYGARGQFRADEEPNALQSWDMTKDTITIEYNDAGGKKHERVYSWEDFARELADMIRSGEYKDDSGD